MNIELSNDAIAICEQIHGKNSVSEIKELFDDICPNLGNLSLKLIFEDIYSNDDLNLKERELINIGALVVQASMPQLRNHILGALNVGCTEKQIVGVILQMIILTGFPNVVNAMLMAKEIFAVRKTS